MSERHIRRPQQPGLYFALLAAAALTVAGSSALVLRIAGERQAMVADRP